LIPRLSNPEMAYVGLCLKMLPVGMVGLVVAAMFAATASALDSDYNVLSGTLTSDFYRRILRRDAGERHLMVVGRITTLLVGAFTIVAALLIPRLGGAFKTLVKNFGITAPPMFIPFIWGLLFRRPPALGVIATLVLGLATGIYTNLFAPVSWGVATVINTGVCLLVMSASSLLLPVSGPVKERVDRFFTRVTNPLPRQVLPRLKDQPSPFYITGIACMAIGVSLIPLAAVPQPGLDRVLTVGSGLILCGLGRFLYRFGKGERATNDLDTDRRRG